VIYFYSKAKGRIGHVGIVYKVSGSTVYTIEGNTSGASNLVTNGGGVKKKSYKMTSSYIDGYGSVDYSVVDGATPVPETILKLGDRVLKLTSPYMEGADVKDLQTRLNKLGFDCGEADGEFGPNTEKGVKAFQTANGLTANGEFDAKTLALLNGESPAKTETVYKVRQGDTLWAISAKFLGKGDYYKRIMEANGMTSTTIRPGMKLKIPT
jgi:nucleoid-associated protein YgaU